jgi:hypothetical protein
MWEGKIGTKPQNTPERRVIPKIWKKVERRVKTNGGSTRLFEIKHLSVNEKFHKKNIVKYQI